MVTLYNLSYLDQTPSIYGVLGSAYLFGSAISQLLNLTAVLVAIQATRRNEIWYIFSKIRYMQYTMRNPLNKITLCFRGRGQKI
ncbi:MAG TPA: hypothetical protein TECP_00823 [Hyphomicrobiaceae bacterium MAG_BT-2024]